MGQLPKRVRIQGNVGDTSARYIKLTDVDSGEEITKCYSAIVVLDVETGTQAALLQYGRTPEGRIAVEAGEPVREQINTEQPEIDVTALAMEIDAPGPASVLETFKSLKDWPLVQFLTWHMILVEEWRFENLADFHVTPTTLNRWNVPRAAWQCRFAFHDGHVVNLFVYQGSRGDFVVSKE